MSQAPDEMPGSLFVRARNAGLFVSQARSVVQSANPELPAAGGVLARDMVEPEFRPWRLGATVFSAFAIVALLITSTGLYGMIVQSLALRRTEIGIRLALGARWTHVVKATVAESVVVVGGAIGAGVVLVVVAGPLLRGVLFETSPRDPMILAQTASILMAITAAAAVVPTVRALLMKPANLLRSE